MIKVGGASSSPALFHPPQAEEDAQRAEENRRFHDNERLGKPNRRPSPVLRRHLSRGKKGNKKGFMPSCARQTVDIQARRVGISLIFGVAMVLPRIFHQNLVARLKTSGQKPENNS
jgi:hypothetical protein